MNKEIRRKTMLFIFVMLLISYGLVSAEKKNRKRQDYYDAEKVKVIRTHQLTTEGAYKDPRWSPEGNIFSAKKVSPYGIAIFELHSSGKSAEEIGLLTGIEKSGNYAWSPDGRKIVYSKYEGGKWHSLWLTEIDREKGRLKIIRNERLTHDGGLDPAWSLDGKKIVFTIKGREGLGIIDSDGTNREVLIEGEEIWEPTFIDINEVLYLKGPTEKEIKSGTYTFGGEEVEIPAGIYGFEEQRQLYKFNIKNNVEKILFPEDIISRFSIVRPNRYENKMYYSTKRGKYKYIVNLKMMEKQPFPAELSFSDFSPNGSKIVFIKMEFENDRTTASDIFIVNSNGTGKTQLTNTAEIIEDNPVWSPDGKWILFEDMKDSSIYISKITRHHE